MLAVIPPLAEGKKTGKVSNMLQDKEPYEIASLMLSEQDSDDRDKLVAEFSRLAGEQAEKVAEVLAYMRRRHHAIDADLQRATLERKRAWNAVSAQRNITTRDRNYLHQLVQALPEEAPIDFDGDEAFHWYGVIARAGILAGYPTDVQRLLEDIALSGHGQAKTAWETADETLTNDGEHPVPVSIEEAVALAQQHAFRRGHPMEPKFHKFWTMVWGTAKSETSLCEVFDEMAFVLGLSDELRPLQSGWFMVSGTFSARVHGEHYAGETPDFDVDDVYSEIDRYSLEITDIEEDY